MTPDQTITNLISTYPGRFSNKWKCAEFLLFILGNGYEWINGELVEYQGTENDIKNLEEAIDNYFSKKMKENYLLNYPIQFIVNSIKLDIKIITSYFTDGIYKPLENTYEIIKLYDLSEKLAIFNIPNNITEDWKIFCKRVICLILNNEKDYDNNLIRRLREIKNNLI